MSEHTHHDQQLTIRMLGTADADELRRVAERDGVPLPAGAVLGAWIGERLVAAIGADQPGARVVADPFEPSGDAAVLLATRARQLGASPRRRLLSLLPRPRAAVGASPPGAGGRLLRL
jgi:hypothetical protein